METDVTGVGGTFRSLHTSTYTHNPDYDKQMNHSNESNRRMRTSNINLAKVCSKIFIKDSTLQSFNFIQNLKNQISRIERYKRYVQFWITIKLKSENNSYRYTAFAPQDRLTRDQWLFT